MALEPLDEALAGFRAFAHPIVFSCEPPEHPEFDHALNPGLMIAERRALWDAFVDRILEDLFPDHFNDMFQIQSMHGRAPGAFMLDRAGSIFHTLEPRSPQLVQQEHKLINARTGLAPCFVHAPNGWAMSAIDEWLRR